MLHLIMNKENLGKVLNFFYFHYEIILSCVLNQMSVSP